MKKLTNFFQGFRLNFRLIKASYCDETNVMQLLIAIKLPELNGAYITPTNRVGSAKSVPIFISDRYLWRHD
jgi:hypothetical protein